MNSTINITADKVDNSTVVVHVDGADFNVPVKNMFDTVLPLSLNNEIISNELGLKFFIFYLSNYDGFPSIEELYNNSNLGITTIVLLDAEDPIHYLPGEFGLIGNVSLTTEKIAFFINSGLTTASQTVYLNIEPDTYNNFNGKSFLKYVIYDNTGAIVTNPGNLVHSVVIIEKL